MKRCKYDWTEIQKAYDEGCTTRDLIKRFGLWNETLRKASQRGDFVYRSKSEAMQLRDKSHARPKCSVETKKKISRARIKYLEENPDKVPYILNHYSKRESYPEKYFTTLFENEKIQLTKKFRIWLYELDFCDEKLKIDIEIDGEQHYLDARIVESDKRRNKWLEEQGWKIYRIRWSDYQKMSMDMKYTIVEDIKKLLGR